MRVIGGAPHGNHPRRLLRGIRLQHGPIQVHGHVVRQEAAHDRLRGGLEEVLIGPRRLALAQPLGLLDRQDGRCRRTLGEGRDEGRVGDRDLVIGAVQEVLHHEPRDRRDAGEGRPVPEPGEVRGDGHSGAAQRLAALASNRDRIHLCSAVSASRRSLSHEAKGGADRVGI